MLFSSVYRIDISNIDVKALLLAKNALYGNTFYFIFVRATKITPSLANAKVIAFPIPFPAPVIRAFLFF
jgi:hypothetical protein